MNAAATETKKLMKFQVASILRSLTALNNRKAEALAAGRSVDIIEMDIAQAQALLNASVEVPELDWRNAETIPEDFYAA